MREDFVIYGYFDRGSDGREIRGREVGRISKWGSACLRPVRRAVRQSRMELLLLLLRNSIVNLFWNCVVILLFVVVAD